MARSGTIMLAVAAAVLAGCGGSSSDYGTDRVERAGRSVFILGQQSSCEDDRTCAGVIFIDNRAYGMECAPVPKRGSLVAVSDDLAVRAVRTIPGADPTERLAGYAPDKACPTGSWVLLRRDRSSDHR
jgi:hypothetical protein